ncbi:YitT family protein, partial [Acinetobacter baumannii]
GHYASGWPFGLLFFAINPPFYGLAWRRMGAACTVKTVIAVLLMAALSEALPHWLGISAINPLFAALGGGLLIGAGMLILFRHRA